MLSSLHVNHARRDPATTGAIERTLKSEWGQVERSERISRRTGLVSSFLRRGVLRTMQRNSAAICSKSPPEFPSRSRRPRFIRYINRRSTLTGALVVAISQSGESTDINMVLERAKVAGASTIGITNEPDSALARLAQHHPGESGQRKKRSGHEDLHRPTICDVSAGHALGAAIQHDDLKKVPEFAAAALELEPEIMARAERYRFMQHAVVVGRGLNYANSFEFALKLMETCYIVAERFSSADLLHGPIAMLEASFPAFVLAPSGVTWTSIRE